MNRKELHDFIEEKQPNICQISCYKDGKEVYSDEWNNYKKIDTCHVMSATKSIVALLVGIALDKGFIKSTDQGLENLNAYLYGDEMAALQNYPQVGLPYCSGYACGYHLIKHYLQKTGKNIVEATLLPAKEILNATEDFWNE